MRAGVIAQRKLQYVLKEHRTHDLILSMRKPIGVQRHKAAADDDEKAEAHPRSDQHQQCGPGQLLQAALRIGQGIDDASKQDGLEKHRGCNCEVGNGQNPAQAGLTTEQLEHTQIDVD